MRLRSIDRAPGHAASAAPLLPDRIRRFLDARTEPTPYAIVHRESTVRLRHYAAWTPNSRPVPVVIAYALINTPAILDLDAERSVVRQFLAAGFDVYVLDWGRPTTLDQARTHEDYVRYLENAVDAARGHADVGAVHLVGCSVTAPLSAVTAALSPGSIRTLSLQGPPLDFGATGGMLAFRELLSPHVDGLVDCYGNVPAELLDAGFVLRKPFTVGVGYSLEFLANLDDPTHAERAGRVAFWSADGPDWPGRAFQEYVARLVVDNRLIENRLSVGPRSVDLDAIDMPVALLIGTEDAYVPPKASLPFLEVIPSEDTAVIEFPTGHVGTFVDAAAHTDGWPRVCDWLAARS